MFRKAIATYGSAALGPAWKQDACRGGISAAAISTSRPSAKAAGSAGSAAADKPAADSSNTSYSAAAASLAAAHNRALIREVVLTSSTPACVLTMLAVQASQQLPAEASRQQAAPATSIKAHPVRMLHSAAACRSCSPAAAASPRALPLLECSTVTQWLGRSPAGPSAPISPTGGHTRPLGTSRPGTTGAGRGDSGMHAPNASREHLSSRDPREHSVQAGSGAAGSSRGAGAAATAAATGRQGGFRGKVAGEPDLRNYPGPNPVEQLGTGPDQAYETPLKSSPGPAELAAQHGRNPAVTNPDKDLSRFPSKVAPRDTPLSDPLADQNVQPNSEMSAGRYRDVDKIDPRRVPLQAKASNPVSYQADSDTGGGTM